MKKIVIAVLVLAVVGFGVWKYKDSLLTGSLDYARDDNVGGKPVVKIGAIFPLSGDFANTGLSFKNVILLARDDLAKRDLKNNYEFIIDDDGFDAKRTISTFNKQKSMDNVDATMSFASSTGKVIAPLAEQSHIIYMNVGASDENVAKGKYNFIHWTQVDKAAEELVKFYKSQGFKKIVRICENDQGSLVIGDALQKKANSEGIEVKSYTFNRGEKDFRILFQKTKADNPDAYFAMVWGGSLVPFMKQYRETSIDKPLTNIEVFSTIDDFNVIEGAYFTDVAQSKDEFVKRLKQEYPDTSSEFAVGNVYDIVMLLVEAFEKADSKEQAVDELAKIKEYDGIVGKLMQDDSGIFHSNAVLKKVVDGKPVVVGE